MSKNILYKPQKLCDVKICITETIYILYNRKNIVIKDKVLNNI